MTHDEFTTMIARMMEAWGDRFFTQPKIDVLWNYIAPFDADLTQHTLRSLVGSRTSCPTPLEFRDACKDELHARNRRGDTAPRQEKPKCELCSDTGRLLVVAMSDHPTRTQNGIPEWKAGDTFSFACSCDLGGRRTSDRQPRYDAKWARWMKPHTIDLCERNRDAIIRSRGGRQCKT